MVRRNPELGQRVCRVAVGDGFQLKLTPKSVNVLLLIVHSSELHQMIANSGMGTVGANHEIKWYINLIRTGALVGVAVLDFEPGSARSKVGTCEFVAEMQLNIRHALQDVQQSLVEACSVNGMNGLD
jgi:hypothetical protein